MTQNQMFVIVFSIGISLYLFISSIIWTVNRTIKNKRNPEKYNKAGLSNVLIFSGILVVSIWLLRFAVSYYYVIMPEEGQQILTWREEFVKSLFSALRTFSMEEEYGDHIVGVKEMVSGIIHNNGQWSFNVVQGIMVAYTSLLNLVAPVVGGAIILEIIASVFPKIMLRLSYLNRRRPKYYFSELNEASLSLAKSIFSEEKNENPILIFTDTYVDDEKEKEYELLLEAKKYGAICVRDDLVHIAKTNKGKIAYYLMDENEFGNFQTLMGLIEDHNVKFIKDSHIYLFVKSDAYVQVEKQINLELDKDEKKKLLNGGEKPIIVPVNAYRNLVDNLLHEVPLYEPLINKDDKKKLNVTIFGNGIIGTEAFLNSYWFGQMMVSCDKAGQKTIDECEMTLNVVSKDEADVFWSKIDYINPELKRTINVLNDDIANSDCELLCYDKEKHTNNPYCNVKYIKADVKSGGFFDSDLKESQEILNSDYFIVALGNDTDNISVADKLRLLIGKKHLEEEKNGNVVIAYAVFNSKLARTLNNKKRYQCREKGVNDIYMYAFGSLERVYSWDNITMSDNKLLAEETGMAYDRLKMRQTHIGNNLKRKRSESSDYTYWADLARAMHVKYKAFSLGLMDKSVFDFKEDESDAYKSYVEGQCEKYRQLAQMKLCGNSSEIKDEFDWKRCSLAWLEHRRWIAFTRVMGYQHTGDFEKNFTLNGESYKNMELKLHPCLVEAKKPDPNNKNIYSQDKITQLFEGFSVDFKRQDLDKETMRSLLENKKEYLKSRENQYQDINAEDLDLLDAFTFEWCKVATSANIEKIDKMSEFLQTVEKISEETKDKFEKVWEGIYCCDFKIYDYCKYDFDKLKKLENSEETKAKKKAKKEA